MVNIGDIVAVTFYARFGFQLDPIAQPTSDLQARLQQSGFGVQKIDALALSAVTTGLTAGLGGWGWVNVTVQPLSSAYGSPQDVASVVAGAAYAVGFEVDFTKVRGSVVAHGVPGQGPLDTSEYEQLQNDSSKVKNADALDELAKTIGVSKSTLVIAALAVGGLVLYGAVKK